MEHLAPFAWPLAVAIIALGGLGLFRAPISALIGRIRRATITGSTVDFGAESETAAAKQREAKELKETKPAKLVDAATHTPPPPNDLYAPLEKEVFQMLDSVSRPPDVERAWLVRAAVSMLMMHSHEVTYRAIFGSQLNLLLLANAGALTNHAAVMNVYETARAAYPELYAQIPFEAWLNYPIASKLLSSDGDAFKITIRGQDFLHYLVANGLTTGKHG